LSETVQERKYRFNFKPFPYHLQLVFTNDLKKSVLNRYPEYAYEDKTGAITLHRDSASIIIFPEETNINHIAHEVTHVVQNFIKYIEAKNCNELEAYYIGWLVFEVAKRAALDKTTGS
jgi:hypothetical protein